MSGGSHEMNGGRVGGSVWWQEQPRIEKCCLSSRCSFEQIQLLSIQITYTR